MDAGFNRRWAQHPRPQRTSATMTLFDKTGLTPAHLRGKVVLDAGCGCGRLSQVALEAGARKVIAVDSSPTAIEATRENAPGAEAIQADLLTLDLGESVDVAFSVGVLHHTADTRQAFGQVARHVKRGGELAVWVYAKHVTDDALFPAFNMLHEITRAVPPETLHAICRKYAVHLRDQYAGAWGPLQQVLRISNSTDDEECVSDTFDWHCPQYRWWHSEAEVKGWFIEQGFAVNWIGQFPVSVRGVRV